MSELLPRVDPHEVGLDADRLARLEPVFASYVEQRRLAGWTIAVARHGKLAHLSMHGDRDREAGLPVEEDTIFRIYSMTKPITSALTLMLFEEGAFKLTDPISRWIPSFADSRVYVRGTPRAMETEPLTRPVTIWNLLTHTAGLTYGFQNVHPVDSAYRHAGYGWGNGKGADLAKACDDWAGIPLLFQPGTRWSYSVATDVLGRLIELVTGKTLDVVMQERIFGPLGMADTGFGVPEDQRHRLAGLYVPGQDKTAHRFDEAGPVSRTKPTLLSGSGGLVSTVADYLRFADMLRRGGDSPGGRLLGPRTVAYMTRNHLPDGNTLATFADSQYSESTDDGVGFGLGVSVVVDDVARKFPGAIGTYGWGGAASTIWWNDPVEDITAVFLTQLLPSGTYPLRPMLSQLIQQAIVD